MSERRWPDTDRELVRAVLALHFGSDHLQLDTAAAAVLDALTAAGWRDLSRVSGYLIYGTLYDPRDVQILTPTEATDE